MLGKTLKIICRFSNYCLPISFVGLVIASLIDVVPAVEPSLNRLFHCLLMAFALSLIVSLTGFFSRKTLAGRPRPLTRGQAVVTVATTGVIVIVCVFVAAIGLFLVAFWLVSTGHLVSHDITPVRAKVAKALVIREGDFACLGSDFRRESTHLFRISAKDISLEGLTPIDDGLKFQMEGDSVARAMKRFLPDQPVPKFDVIYEVRLEFDTLVIARAKETVYIVFFGMS